MTSLLQNLNLAIVAVGFVALESGIAVHWSAAVAAIVGGGVLMFMGSWRYLASAFRKRT